MQLSINSLKVYTPAKDFEESRRFYAALGFEQKEAWGESIDCKLGGAEFRLQNYYVADWADNFMMLFNVDDVLAWYEHAKKVIDDGKFNARVSEPEVVGGDTTICHVFDPSGVLLIFIN